MVQYDKKVFSDNFFKIKRYSGDEVFVPLPISVEYLVNKPPYYKYGLPEKF